jgi:hypothetical protein
MKIARQNAKEKGQMMCLIQPCATSGGGWGGTLPLVQNDAVQQIAERHNVFLTSYNAGSHNTFKLDTIFIKLGPDPGSNVSERKHG